MVVKVMRLVKWKLIINTENHQKVKLGTEPHNLEV